MRVCVCVFTRVCAHTCVCVRLFAHSSPVHLLIWLRDFWMCFHVAESLASRRTRATCVCGWKQRVTCSKISGKAEARWDRACLLLFFHCETLHTHTHTHSHACASMCMHLCSLLWWGGDSGGAGQRRAGGAELRTQDAAGADEDVIAADNR